MIRCPAAAAPHADPNDREDAPPASKRVRRSRRPPEERMTEERRLQARDNVRATKTASHAKSTRYNYSSYYPAFHKWYKINAPEMLKDDVDELDPAKVRAACLTSEGLKEQLQNFENFLDTRTHHKETLPNGKKAPAKLGTMLGYRTSFGYYVWAKDVSYSLGIPPQWHAGLKSYYSGLKQRMAELKQKGLGKLTEGKNKMCLRLFLETGKFFQQEGKTIPAFSNSWSWNLMCRHSNLDELNANHMGFKQDAITVQYGKDKNHTDGNSHNKTAMLKHVFANPFMPSVSQHLLQLPS